MESLLAIGLAAHVRELLNEKQKEIKLVAAP